MSDRREYEIGGARIELVRGDITHESTDAIVNAANSGLRGGAGVDGAIHAAGGPSILAACREIGGCDTGEAVATGAGNLPCRWVIHAVGPRYGRENGREAELLESAYRNSLARARELGARSVAFPSLSTGAYGYPLEEAAPIALSALADELRTSGPQRVRLVLFTDEALAVFVRAADRLLGADA